MQIAAPQSFPSYVTLVQLIEASNRADYVLTKIIRCCNFLYFVSVRSVLKVKLSFALLIHFCRSSYLNKDESIGDVCCACEHCSYKIL